MRLLQGSWTRRLHCSRRLCSSQSQPASPPTTRSSPVPPVPADGIAGGKWLKESVGLCDELVKPFDLFSRNWRELCSKHTPSRL